MLLLIHGTQALPSLKAAGLCLIRKRETWPFACGGRGGKTWGRWKPNSTLAKRWLQTTGSLEVEDHGAELTEGFVEAEGRHDVHVLSRVWLFATPWTGAHQAPLSLGSSGQECWRGLLCPPPGDLPDPAIEPASLMSPALGDKFFTTSAIWEARTKHRGGNKNCSWPLTQDSQKGL